MGGGGPRKGHHYFREELHLKPNQRGVSFLVLSFFISKCYLLAATPAS